MGGPFSWIPSLAPLFTPWTLPGILAIGGGLAWLGVRGHDAPNLLARRTSRRLPRDGLSRSYLALAGGSMERGAAAWVAELEALFAREHGRSLGARPPRRARRGAGETSRQWKEQKALLRSADRLLRAAAAVDRPAPFGGGRWIAERRRRRFAELCRSVVAEQNRRAQARSAAPPGAGR